MKGGHTPIHFMRWAPSDYVNDPWVKLAAKRNDAGALAVYHLFLNHAFMEGGYLPSDPDLLAGVLGLSVSVVKKALAYWTAPACGLIRIKGARAWNPRVLRDVGQELAYRKGQSELGKKGGRPAKGKRKGSVSDPESPPSPFPAPSPSPSPSPAPAPRPAPSPSGARSSSAANGAPPPAAGGAWVDYNPANELEALLVKRCEELADLVVTRLPDPLTVDEERRSVLAAITGTERGKSMDAIRGASPAWIERSLRAATDFERDVLEADAVERSPNTDEPPAPPAKEA